MLIDKSSFLKKLNRCYERLSLADGATPDTAFEDFLKIFLTKIYYEEKYERDMVLDIALGETVFEQFESIRMQCHDKLHCSQYFSQYDLICQNATAVSMALQELKGFTLLGLVDTDVLQGFEMFLSKYLRKRQNGMYTHYTLVQFVIGLLMPSPMPNYSGRLGDPECGCGLFLSYYLRLGAHKMFSIGAVCNDPLMVVAIRINLYIQGIRDHVADVKYRKESSLASGFYDMIASSIPDYNLELVIEAIDACSDSGRICLIINRGVFFEDEHKDLRQYILQNTYIESITFVPENVFFNGMTTPRHCVVTLKKKNTTASYKPYRIAISSVTDAGVSVLGLSTSNKQLSDVEDVINEWQRTGVEVGGERTVFIDSDKLTIDNVVSKLRRATTRYNDRYKIVHLSDILTISRYKSIKPRIGRIYKRLLIDFENFILLKDEVYEVGNNNKVLPVAKGQFVIGLRYSINFTHAIVPSSRRTIIVEPSYSVFDIDVSLIDPSYLHYVLGSPAVKRQLDDLQSINRNSRISISQILNLEIPLPSIVEQKILTRDIVLYTNHLERTKTLLKESKDSFYKLLED